MKGQEQLLPLEIEIEPLFIERLALMSDLAGVHVDEDLFGVDHQIGDFEPNLQVIPLIFVLLLEDVGLGYFSEPLHICFGVIFVLPGVLQFFLNVWLGMKGIWLAGEEITLFTS